MKNTLIIFENSLSNLKKDEVKDLLEDLSFNLAYKQISQDPHSTKKILNSLLVEFLTILKKLDLFDDENVAKDILKSTNQLEEEIGKFQLKLSYL